MQDVTVTIPATYSAMNIQRFDCGTIYITALKENNGKAGDRKEVCIISENSVTTSPHSPALVRTITGR